MSSRRERPPRASTPLTSVLSRRSLYHLAGPRSYERGEQYFHGGCAALLARDGERLSARVRGTRTYHVQLWAGEGELGFSCTCPMGARGAFCKHCVAAGLAWLKREEGAPEDREGLDLDELRGFLARQEKSRLVDLLVEQAAADEHLLRTLSLEMVCQGLEKPDLAALRRVLGSALDPGGGLPCEEAQAFADNCHTVVETLADLLRKGRYHEVIELAEVALEGGERALEQIDDSDGAVGAMVERLQDLHLAAHIGTVRLEHRRQRSFQRTPGAAQPE
jgi:uncharacterized Zn finger protein